MEMQSADSREQAVLMSFDNLLAQLEAYKPNDRSKQDRYWAIVNTEVEKAKAVFVTYCEDRNGQAESGS